jgi:hypothetical protein
LDVLIQAMPLWSNPTARQALALAIEPYRGHELTRLKEQWMVDWAMNTLRDSPYQAVRSAAQWLLARWNLQDEIDRVSTPLARSDVPTLQRLQGRDWWVTQEGHTMAVVRQRATIRTGHPSDSNDD